MSNISLQHFDVEKVDLTLDSGTTVKTGSISIENVHDGSLTLDEITPRELHLSITRAVAKDIEWTRPVPSSGK